MLVVIRISIEKVERMNYRDKNKKSLCKMPSNSINIDNAFGIQ